LLADWGPPEAEPIALSGWGQMKPGGPNQAISMIMKSAGRWKRDATSRNLI
jgi:hypothetical protein